MKNALLWEKLEKVIYSLLDNAVQFHDKEKRMSLLK
jgi:hypothetical protein